VVIFFIVFISEVVIVEEGDAVKKIDVHCHFYPAEYVQEIERRKLFEVRTRPKIWESVDARIADMDNFSIERQVLSLSAPFVYFEDDELNLHLSRTINDFLIDITDHYPDRFSGIIAVPLRNIKHALDELKRAVTAPGIVGVGIASHIKGRMLTSAEFAPFFEEVDRLAIPVMVHPEYPLGIGKVNDYQDFYRSMGFLWETTMAVGRMALSGFFEKYKSINWMFCHLGGALPFLYTSMDMCQKRNPGKEHVAPKPVSSYLRNLYMDTARLVTAPILDCAIDLYGKEHILFGTDIPFAYDVASLNVPRLDALDLPEPTRQMISYKNAQKLFNL
jgi:aminocarboxymuconate-semialdehyde decarboxylase